MRLTSFIGRVTPLLLICSVSVQAQRTSRDPERASDEWLDKCREGRGRSNDDRDRVCEVREKRLSPTRMLDIDGKENGGVSVHGWDRSEVLILAKIQADADDADEAKDVAAGITNDVHRARVRADGPSTRDHQARPVRHEV